MVDNDLAKAIAEGVKGKKKKGDSEEAVDAMEVVAKDFKAAMASGDEKKIARVLKALKAL